MEGLLARKKRERREQRPERPEAVSDRARNELFSAIRQCGVIDAAELARDPTRATVLRTWSSEPDQFGHIERADGHWLFRCPRKRGEDIYRMPAVPLGLHDQVTLEDPSGTTYPFTIASIGGTNRPAARA